MVNKIKIFLDRIIKGKKKKKTQVINRSKQKENYSTSSIMLKG